MTNLGQTPWHNNDSELQKLDFQELYARGQAFGWTSLSLGGLDNNIHPLFQNLRATRPSGEWDPALRLASRLLTEPCIISFWHTLFLQPLVFLNDESYVYGMQCPSLWFKAHSLTPDQDIHDTLSALDRLSHYVDIVSSPSAILGEKWAVTTRNPGSLWQFQDPIFKGTPATINISPALTSQLDPSLTMPTDQRLRLHYLFAINLCHEVAHAAYMAREPMPPGGIPYDIEPFLERQRVPELGCAWETTVFGGHNEALGNFKDCRWGIGVATWPNERYEWGINLPQTGQTVPYIRIGTLQKKWYSTYVTPMPFIEELFSRDFWYRADGTAAVQLFGARAFVAPKMFGVRRRNPDFWNDDPNITGFSHGDEDLQIWHDEGWVLRLGQPRPPPTPPPEFDDDDDDDDNYGDTAIRGGFSCGFDRDIDAMQNIPSWRLVC